MFNLNSTFNSVYDELSVINEAWPRMDTEIKEDLQEAKRIISDQDILYHWTNPTPLVQIFTENTLRADVHLNAVCLTTDENYKIYGYPCGIQFSRERLLAAGYELELFDEYEDDFDSPGESEERIYKNIENVSDYVTAVYINWEHIAVVRSKDGDRIADATYDEQGNEDETYDLRLNNFMSILDSLKAKGINIIQEGEPEYDEYYLDDNGKLEYGKMPA